MLFLTGHQAYRQFSADWRWPHFSTAELGCRCAGRFCAGEYWHDPDFLDALEALRGAMGAPLRVTSGHRCELWNASVGGAALSKHKTLAVDIALAGHERERLRRSAYALGFRGQGLARTFIHLDRRERPATWFYKGSQSLWQTY